MYVFKRLNTSCYKLVGMTRLLKRIKQIGKLSSPNPSPHPV